MTKTDEALKIMQDFFELERRVKIMEEKMKVINKKMIDTFPEGIDPDWSADQQTCLEVYHYTNEYCI